MRSKKITVKVDSSTFEWLSALAEANSNTELHPHPVSAAELLRQAAFCMADYAGRRDGSWEADVGRNLLVASGYQGQIPYLKQGDLLRREDKRNAAHRARTRLLQVEVKL